MASLAHRSDEINKVWPAPLGSAFLFSVVAINQLLIEYATVINLDGYTIRLP